MTAQIPDMIAIDGGSHPLFSEPLSAYCAAHTCPAFIPANTGNWRGYQATWEIREGRLYITSLQGKACSWPPLGGPKSWYCGASEHDSWEVTLGDIFRAQAGPVFAQWFSGSLKVPLGRMVSYVHMGYESKYEAYLLLQVDEGIVTSRLRLNGQAMPF